MEPALQQLWAGPLPNVPGLTPQRYPIISMWAEMKKPFRIVQPMDMYKLFALVSIVPHYTQFGCKSVLS